MKKKQPPKHLIIYKCNVCGRESGFSDIQVPVCRHCGNSTKLVMVSKERITREVMFNRLKIVTDNVLFSLSQAYDQLPIVDQFMVTEFQDSETGLLRIMNEVQKIRDKLDSLSKEKNS